MFTPFTVIRPFLILLLPSALILGKLLNVFMLAKYFLLEALLNKRVLSTIPPKHIGTFKSACVLLLIIVRASFLKFVRSVVRFLS